MTQTQTVDIDTLIQTCINMAGSLPCPVEDNLQGGWLKILEVPNELKGFVVTICNDKLPEHLVQPLTEEFWKRVKALPEFFTTLEMGSEIRLFSNWQVAAIYDNGDQD